MKRFVIHEHKANRAGLHYDLRLETSFPGKGKGLLSFASRKLQALLDKKLKRVLLFETAWHETFWLHFKGVIAEGYGKGELSILDSGKYELLKDQSMYKAYTGGHIVIHIHGKKYDECLSLVRMDKIKNEFNGINPKKTWLCTLVHCNRYT